jgi:hypothetical protein
MNEEEQLMLPLGQVVDRRQQRSDVAFLLFLDDSRRMLARRRQMNARFRAIDLDQTFRPAADGADARPERWAVATPFSATA